MLYFILSISILDTYININKIARVFLKKVAKATISMLRFICMGEIKSLSPFGAVLEIDFEPKLLLAV